MNVEKGSLPWALSTPARPCLLFFFPGHLSGLCLQQAILRDRLRYHFGEKADLLTTYYKSEFPKLSVLNLG